MLFLSSLNTACGPGRSRLRKLAAKNRMVPIAQNERNCGPLDRVVMYDKGSGLQRKVLLTIDSITSLSSESPSSTGSPELHYQLRFLKRKRPQLASSLLPLPSFMELQFNY